MREILFKAKRADNGEWVKGYLWIGNNHAYITPDNIGISYDEAEKRIKAFAYEIDKSTICQYTGLTDKNGEKIFEGDIVEISEENGYFKLEWEEDTARWSMNNEAERFIVHFDNYWSYEVEVIGNIFDNPELLEVSCVEG